MKSEDTDVLAYGSPKFLTKVNIISETCMEIDFKVILEKLEMSEKEFLDMCIMCGTDYNTNIPKIGPQKSYNLIKKHKSIDNLPMDTSILKHDRCRELFTFKDDYFKERIRYCGIPDYNKLEIFIFQNNCKIDMNYVRKCFECKDLIFN